ncbi:MAG: ribbon-helix-helix protein, CopG family [Actinomycetota bacterium]|jgi:metal-responsive CopG/Arc/MetJ family transcriptional regulator|nr:ribbon-helix-helix protein, CopG family [Rubrobacter sp.]MDQ3508282.1 ribbon-helix-helix protein, CopG family [Actinomycetota bacterium]
MEREKITIEIEESLLRSAREMAERGGKSEDEIFEEALEAYVGFDFLDRIHERLEREGLALSEEESLKLAYEELHAMRAERDDAESRESQTG